jgi:dihydrodiol dehydrogenase / D-xylose 1-dehydrogenase (NADP)
MALGNGKHVLCEKPLCVNTRETKELIEFARQKKRFLMEVMTEISIKYIQKVD